MSPNDLRGLDFDSRTFATARNSMRCGASGVAVASAASVNSTSFAAVLLRLIGLSSGVRPPHAAFIPESQRSRAAVCAATEAEGVTRRRQLAGVARPTRCDDPRPEGPGAPYEGERRSCARLRWRRSPPRLPLRPKATLKVFLQLSLWCTKMRCFALEPAVLDANEVIDAIKRVASTARLARRNVDASRREMEQALGDIARLIRTTGNARARELATILKRTALRPVEPRDLEWNIFELFGLEWDEPAWTHWFAQVLNPAHGADLASLFWRSLCRSAREALGRKEAVKESEATQWSSSALSPPGLGGVHAEFAYPGKGIVDLYIETSDSIVIVENKLWEDWHDWVDGSKQADRYRDIAASMSGQRRLPYRLVLLSARDDLEYVEGTSPGEFQVPSDYLWISYAQLVRALRVELATPVPSGQVLRFWPAFLTVNAIEGCVLGLYPPTPETATWHDLSQLTRAISLTQEGSGGGTMARKGFDEIGRAYAREYEAIESARVEYLTQRNGLATAMLDRLRSALAKGQTVLRTTASDKQPYREIFLDGPYSRFRVSNGRSGAKDCQAGIGFTFSAWELFTPDYGLSTYLFFRMGTGSFRALRSELQGLAEKHDKRFLVGHEDSFFYVRIDFVLPDSEQFGSDTFLEAMSRLPALFAGLEAEVLGLYKALKERD